ncbi:hypothetical protein J2046_002602 [Rhizobium petrolearium]|uniref:hypothetical protein n=1 Tax=Neorhizobium petrolearium TaxID=515361 RepID=UPI001F2F8490|nr:hypothetical protein [Neorhizobium petrolearium]MBP1844343.1 hypothetical protein [Neorhizobium petrolearium]
MTGIVVIDSDPIQPGIQIVFHLLHEITSEGSHVRHIDCIFGCHDEPELMPVVASALDERLSIGLILNRGKDPALLAILRHAIAFQIAQVCIDCLGRRRSEFRATRLTPLRGELHHPHLDDNTPRAEPGAAATTRPSSTVIRKRWRKFCATAPGIEPPAAVTRRSAYPVGVSACLAHGDLHLCEKRFRMQAGATAPALRSARFDVETVVVTICHIGRFDPHPRPGKRLLAVIAGGRKKT